MIAPAGSVRRKKSPVAWHDVFLGMLPAIREQARYAFRNLRPEPREDAIEKLSPTPAVPLLG